jgi:D-tyrosyl-tRNA(Tyr) deacylase
MRVVVQRVSEASVTIDGAVVGTIGRGLLLLVGLARGDGEAAIAWMAHKIEGLRVFSDADGLMNASLADVGGRVLAVPQFTLLGDCRKGRRPSFAAAMPPAEAERLFGRFVARLAAAAGSVVTGRFGATMQVQLVNDGPVTLVIER